MTVDHLRSATGQPLSRRYLEATPAITPWRPDIVIATTMASAFARPAVVVAEPGVRLEAVGARLGTARTLLAALAEARETLGAVAAEAELRVADATSTRERVTATIAAYRAEAMLDGVLTGTWRQVSALMRERGLR
jgi:hypothetical protein